MIIIRELEVGKTIISKEFTFTNKYGGSGMSNWEHDEKFPEPISAIVVKRWDDDECGERSWCIPDETNKELMEYLERNAKKGPSEWYIDSQCEDEVTESVKDKFVLYIGEFDLLK